MSTYANTCPECGFPIAVRYDKFRRANFVKEHERIVDGARVRCRGTGRSPVVTSRGQRL